MKGGSRAERKQQFRQQLTLLALVWFALLTSGLMVVYSAHDARLKFDELEVLRRQQDQLHIVWSQYLLEEGAWASFGRIEKIATEKLSMQIPSVQQIIMVSDNEN